MCKTLYESNYTLRSKHEALIARLPLSPLQSMSSPGGLSAMASPVLHMSLVHSSSESQLGATETHTSYFPGPLRKVSMSTADVDFLADQNAELLEKLERLEAEANSADLAGRRELKRLEKEIAFLKEALEKTVAKSEELEEKVHDVVGNEAARKRKEREARVRAMRQLGKTSKEDTVESVKNFAPEGSRYGGPSGSYSLASSFETSDEPSESLPKEVPQPPVPPPPVAQDSLISQLLQKVKELEETNTRILQQQADTAQQLSVVQRDTENINKVYESLVDPVSTDLTFSDAEQEEDPVASSAKTMRFRTFRRTLEMDQGPTDKHAQPPRRHATTGSHRSRKSATLGLFDEPADGPWPIPPTMGDFASHSWSEGYNRSSFSALGGSGALSPLHFFSPATHSAPLAGLSLQSELDQRLGGDWEMNGGRHHLRSSSILELSQLSVPATPSPVSRQLSRRSSEDAPRLPSSIFGDEEVEPATPVQPAKTDPFLIAVPSLAAEQVLPLKSPRMQMMMDTIRSRHGRWDTRRFDNYPAQQAVKKKTKSRGKKRSTSDAEMLGSSLLGFPKRISDVVDNMIGKLDAITHTPALPRNQEEERRRRMEKLRRRREEEDDGTRIPKTPPRLPHSNALKLHVVTPSPEKIKEDRQNSSIILEIWLWIQLALIVFIFLWNVAKRGPRKVLLADAAEKVVAKRK